MTIKQNAKYWLNYYHEDFQRAMERGHHRYDWWIEYSTRLSTIYQLGLITKKEWNNIHDKGFAEYQIAEYGKVI